MHPIPTRQTAAAKEHLYLVDGSSFIFRAYYALPKMSRSDGTPINAVFGFASMLYKLLEDLANSAKPTHLAVIFDAARESFRNEIYPSYKAQRPDAPEDLIPQFDLIREAVKAFNVPCIEMSGFEADDIIATYARQASEQGMKVTIVSSDKDLMQLVTDRVELFDSMKNRPIGPNEVKEKFGVLPDKVTDVQALAGDSVDNIPGVPGIGIKTAAELINTFGDLETLLKRAHEIPQPKRREKLIAHAKDARVAKKLVTLKNDVPLALALDKLTVREVKPHELIPFLERMEFKSLKSKAEGKLGKAPDAHTPSPPSTKIDTARYSCVTDLKSLKRWIDRAIEQGHVAVDTETTGLDPMRATLVGVSLALADGDACYIPLRHSSAGSGNLDFEGKAKEAIVQISPTAAVPELKRLLEDSSVLKIGQNMKYDYLVFRGEGIEVSPFDDTMLMSYVLDCGLHGHGMNELSELHLAHKPIAFKDVAGTGKFQVTFDYVPLEKATAYAAEDADVTLRLWKLLKPQLARKRLVTVYETLERPLVPILAQMEEAGVAIDSALLKRLSQEFAARLAQLEHDIHALAGETFNVASPRQLGTVLFEKMKLEGGRRGKSGEYSTDADTLERLAAEGHKLPGKILEWRQLAKLKSTYTDALHDQVNPKTKRIHTSYALAGTSTGRLASTDPNVQNIPIRTEEGRKIRTAFVADTGNVLLSADYSQIELRLLAHLANIDTLKQAFREGVDIHALTASEVFGVSVKGMDPMVRRSAKAINYGIVYGMSAYGLAAQIGVSREEAKAYMEAYFKRFPGIKEYMESTKEFCRKHGYVVTLFGRRCHLPSIHNKNSALRAFAERAAINAPLQGTAADIIRRAMIRLPKALAEGGLKKVRMLLQVHDELVFEMSASDVARAAPVIRRVMERASEPVVRLDVPLVVDCHHGKNWDEAH